MKTVSGWAFPDVDEFMAHELNADGTYQHKHLKAALRYVKDRSLAIDGGAHVGTWTRQLSAFFDRVLAIEPSPDTFEALSSNVQTFACQNVELYQAALGSRTGFVSMAPLEGKAEALKNTGARFVQPGGEIPLIRIDDWKLERCGFLKLDIEGSEVSALRGAADTLLRCRPIVLFEDKGLWRRYGEARNAPQLLLQRLGYRKFERISCDEIWGPR